MSTQNRQLNDKELELLINAYKSHLKGTESPLTPQNLRLLKYLLIKGFIESVKYPIGKKNFTRFDITKRGISFLFTATNYFYLYS